MPVVASGHILKSHFNKNVAFTKDKREVQIILTEMAKVSKRAAQFSKHLNTFLAENEKRKAKESLSHNLRITEVETRITKTQSKSKEQQQVKCADAKGYTTRAKSKQHQVEVVEATCAKVKKQQIKCVAATKHATRSKSKNDYNGVVTRSKNKVKIDFEKLFQ